MKKVKSVFNGIIFALLLFVLIMFLLSLYFVVIRHINKSAHLSLLVDDIDEIYELRADGIAADFVDNYYFDSTEWTFRDSMIFEAESPAELELLMPDGEWKPVESILLQPVGEAPYKLRMPELQTKARVDYAIRVGAAQSGDQKLASVLSYKNHASEDYSFSLTAPSMLAEIYWESEENANREYLEISLSGINVCFKETNSADDYKSIYSDCLRICTINFYDKKVGGYWQVAPFYILGEKYDNTINFTFAPYSHALSDEAGKTLLSAYYLSSLDAKVSGKLSFRFATHDEEYNLRRERIAFKIDDNINEETKTEATKYSYISFGDGGAAVGDKELHYPMLKINTTIDADEDKRNSSFSLDTPVIEATLNDLSLFPNGKTFFAENWSAIAVLSIIISFVAIIISQKDNAKIKIISKADEAEVVSGGIQINSTSEKSTICSSDESKLASQTANSIFISHRSLDKEVAEMLFDFFVITGIPREAIFCSSLPGNDVKQNVSEEVRKALKSSKVNIAILSEDYFESTYCLNEAGAFWVSDTVPVIPIALPEITSDKMKGFLNKDYKLRHLDNADDIFYVYETITDALGLSQEKPTTINIEIGKIVKRYKEYIADRNNHCKDCSINTASAGAVTENIKPPVIESAMHRLEPVFDVKITSINSQVPGTAEAIDIYGNKPFPKHKNVQLAIELCNDIIVRNLKVFGRLVDTVAKNHKSYQMTVCYQESPDVRWSRQVHVLTRDLYPASENGIPVIISLEFWMDNNDYRQVFRLNKEQVYMPEPLELVKPKDIAKVIQTKNQMMADFLKPSSEIGNYSPDELLKFPVHKFISSEVVIVSKDCQDTKWNTDGGYGKYEIFDFCDEGLLLWDAMATSVEVICYRQNELQKADTNRLLCLPFESVITYDLKGNSGYNLPIIYADFEMSEYKYYYRDKSSLMLVDNAMIVDVKE